MSPLYLYRQHVRMHTHSAQHHDYISYASSLHRLTSLTVIIRVIAVCTLGSNYNHLLINSQ